MAALPEYRFSLACNAKAKRDAAYGPAQAAVFDEAGLERARFVITAWPGYAPTPLVSLPGLARALGVARIDYKNEAPRFGVGSFKPLGGAYAVARLLMREIARRTGAGEPAIGDLLAKRHGEIAAAVTVTAATDGNHGRAVAWGARMFGCRCVIFIHETVTAARARAIAALGAEVRRAPGTFDDAVRIAQEIAEAEGWVVVSDTSDGRLVEVPRDVMQGYSLMADETIVQLGEAAPPSHVFLQAGVGGMAAASCARFWRAFGARRPITVLVEPETAACWFASLEAGRPVSVGGPPPSILSAPARREVSRPPRPTLFPSPPRFRSPPRPSPSSSRAVAGTEAGGHFNPAVARVGGVTPAASPSSWARAASTAARGVMAAVTISASACARASRRFASSSSDV